MLQLVALLVIYVLLVAAGLALVLFPGVRARAGALLGSMSRQVGAHARMQHSRARAVARAAGITARPALALHEPLGSRREVWIIASALLLMPVAAVLLGQRWITLDGYVDSYGHDDARRSEVIAGLLAGERLTPPQPLPPEVFLTREVLAERPHIGTASRNWALLHDDFSQRLLRVFKAMREEGYELVLLEGYRSPERQRELAAIGEHVTRADAYQSYHQFGLAADCAFLRNGKIVISERDPWAMQGYVRYGELAEREGLTWGGRWKLMDFGHVELRRADLKKLAHPPATHGVVVND